MRQKWKKRRLAAMLAAAALLVTNMPVHVLAVENGTDTGAASALCEHHTAHTAECGYSEAGGYALHA